MRKTILAKTHLERDVDAEPRGVTMKKRSGNIAEIFFIRAVCLLGGRSFERNSYVNLLLL